MTPEARRRVAADPGPDCSMKYTPPETAYSKLKALAERAAIVRRELRGS